MRPTSFAVVAMSKETKGQTLSLIAWTERRSETKQIAVILINI